MMPSNFRRVFRLKKVRAHATSEHEDVIVTNKSRFSCQFTFPNDVTMMLSTRRGTLDVFSLRTGARLFSYRGHDDVDDIAARLNFKWMPKKGSKEMEVLLDRFRIGLVRLDDNTVASIYRDGPIVVRRIFDGIELHRDPSDAACFSPLKDGCFLVGTRSGDVIHVQWDDTGRLARTRDILVAESNVITRISVCRNRFVTCSVTRTDREDYSFRYRRRVYSFGIFELASFNRIAENNQLESNPICIHLTDLLLVAGCEDGKIWVYDSFTLQAVHEIETEHVDGITSVHVMDDGRHLLSTGWGGLISIQNIETGYPVWQKQFDKNVSFTTPLSHQRPVTRFAEGVVLLHSFPQEVEELMIPPPTPLRDAFQSCLSGAEKPSEKCKELISFDRSCASFDEWYCAHQLLMSAVEDGEIPPIPNYDGEISWWFKNLYLAAKGIQKLSADDSRTMERCLVQAKAVGVLEGVEPVLAAIRITNDLNAVVRRLQLADILMLGRILSIETRLENLKEAFARYRQYVRTSQLIGVALQIIPIAGGSIAGVVSAGAEIVEGLSAKDLTDYFLGLGSSLALDEVSSMSDRVFSSAASALRPEQLARMNMEHRLKLEEAVKSCGMSLDTLRELFIEKAGHVRNTRCDILGTGTAGGMNTVDVVVVEEAEDETEPIMLQGGKEDTAAHVGETGAEMSDMDFPDERSRANDGLTTTFKSM